MADRDSRKADSLPSNFDRPVASLRSLFAGAAARTGDVPQTMSAVLGIRRAAIA